MLLEKNVFHRQEHASLRIFPSVTQGDCNIGWNSNYLISSVGQQAVDNRFVLTSLESDNY